jgi:hypothetical protein
VQRLQDALGFTPPAASDHIREDDQVVVELFQQLLAGGVEQAAGLRLLRTYADALRRLTQAEADLYEAQGRGAPAPSGTEAAIAEVDLHLPAELHIADRTDLEARELRPGRFAFATAGSLFYVASDVAWQVGRRTPSVRR